MTVPQMFFAHVSRVVDHLNINHARVRVIMWDDMFRELDLETITGKELGCHRINLLGLLPQTYIECT